nr:MAG TPA: hypothetical protein [Caudoviricetes sp.]
MGYFEAFSLIFLFVLPTGKYTNLFIFFFP